MRLFSCPFGGDQLSEAKTFGQIIGINKTIQKFKIVKSDDEKRQVFGWGSVAARASGEVVQDWQDDIIDIDELEQAAYAFTKDYATAGEMHERGGVGELIESTVFTKAKAAALGIPDGILPEGWWLGFQITDDDIWQKIKSGDYGMFSIEGTGQRIPVEQGGTS